MAISLSRFKQAGAKQTIAKKLAREYEAQQRKAQKRKGWSGLIGKGVGAVLGAAAAGFTVATGGLAAPLMAAAGQFAGRKIGHELTRGMAADTSKISGGDKYGYGKEESKTLKEMLESQMAVDPLKERGGFGKDVLSSYISAGMAGELTPGVGKLLKGEKGAITGQTGDFKFGKMPGWSGAKEEVGKLFPGFSPESEPAIIEDDILAEAGGYEDKLENVFSPLHQPTIPASQKEFPDMPDFGVNQEEDIYGVSEELPNLVQPSFMKEGGIVEDKNLTIAEYFDMQGISLGGSNKQSIGQMLGRK